MSFDLRKFYRFCAQLQIETKEKGLQRLGSLLGTHDMGLVSSKTIWLYLAKARDLGDVRARHRRVRRENFVKVLMDSFEAADGGYLGWDDFRMLLWGGVDVPATWRTVVRVGISDCRKSARPRKNGWITLSVQKIKRGGK